VTGAVVPRSSGHDGEPTLADVQREFASYECWRGVSGLCYARLHGRPRADIQGEDPRDLRDQIIRHQAQLAEEVWRAAQMPEPSAQGLPPASPG
jgi:hypothetical protein